MSRIKGKYAGAYTTIRWLDPATGRLYETETAKRSCHSDFVVQPDGTWVNGDFVWQAAAALAADWYVMRLVPDERRGLPTHLKDTLPDFFAAFGPYTEEEARKNAALRSEKSVGPNGRREPQAYAVVQVQAGNTVIVQPPAPPAPVTIWS